MEVVLPFEVVLRQKQEAGASVTTAAQPTGAVESGTTELTEKRANKVFCFSQQKTRKKPKQNQTYGQDTFPQTYGQDTFQTTLSIIQRNFRKERQHRGQSNFTRF